MTPTIHQSHPKGLPAPHEYAEHLEKHHPDPEVPPSGAVALIVCVFIGGLMGGLFALFF